MNSEIYRVGGWVEFGLRFTRNRGIREFLWVLVLLHNVTWARNFVCTISMQNQVKMFRDVSPTFSMDIAPKWPYFSGKTIFLEPRGVSKIDFNIFLRPIWLICHYKMESEKRLILAISQVMSTDFNQIWLKITIDQIQL